MLADVDKNILENSKLEVAVMEENASRNDVVLGTGNTGLRRLCGGLNSNMELSIELVDSNKAICGVVLITAKLAKSDPSKVLDVIPEEMIKMPQGKLIVSKISGFDLKGGDFGGFGDKPVCFLTLFVDDLFQLKQCLQDPYVTITCGDWSAATPHINNGGRFPVWENIPGMETVLNRNQILFNRLSVAVQDKNKLTSDAPMGCGDISLRGLGSKPNAINTFTIRLKDARGQFGGKLVLEAMVVSMAAAVEASSEKLASKGVLQIASANLTEMQKQTISPDISLQFSVGDKWMVKTPVNPGVGTSSVWKLAIESKLFAAAQLRKNGLTCQVISKSRLGDSIIGTAEIPLQEILTGPGSWCTIHENVFDKKTNKGKLSVRCSFLPEGQESTMMSEMEKLNVVPAAADSALPSQYGGLDNDSLMRLSAQVDTVVSNQETLVRSISVLEERLQKKMRKVRSGFSGFFFPLFFFFRSWRLNERGCSPH